MPVTRKEFLKTSSLLLGGLMFGGFRIPSFAQDLGKGFRLINYNLGIYTERGGTILWYASKEGSAIVDAQYPETAKNLIEGLKKISERKIDFLFNTHHHGDHTAGNFFLRDYVDKIVASENCARLQRERNGGGEKEKTQAYPDLTFAGSAIYGVGKEQVAAYHFGPAHTGGDSIYHFVHSDVVHMGDLVFNGLCPFFNLADGGSFRGWINYLDKVTGKFGGDTKFVFGHSADPEKLIGKKEDLVKMKDYISFLLDYVSKGKKEGKTKEEIAASIDVSMFAGIKEMRAGMIKGNAEQAFDELSR